MKILIAYASRGGASRACAEMLAEKLRSRNDVSVVDVAAVDTIPAPDGFDVAVLGGSVRMARIDKRLKKYLVAHKERLSAMPSAFFFCCGFPSELDEYIDTQIPKDLELSLGIHCFGGELKPEKLKGMDKFIVKMIRKGIVGQDFEMENYNHPLPELLPESVWRLSDSIMELK